MKLSRSSTLGLAALLALAACHPSRDNAQGESAGGENAAGAAEQADSRASAGETAPNGDAEAARTPLHAPPDVAAPPANAQRTASGLASRVITPGDGAEHPTARSRVTVNYTGWTSDGHMFDSSISRGQPATFPLNGVIAGWTEGVQLMVTGETRRLWIPANLAYGDDPRPGAPAGMLVFDIELLDFTRPPTVPSAPEDVAAAPANAERTASGLASRVITPGDGAEHPTARSRVTVNYTGWTTNGHMFDSSISRGQPATFPLNGVIAGWTEGVQLMVTGETRRFWIPANLAYGDHPRAGAPQGMLVFDVQLIRFE